MPDADVISLKIPQTWWNPYRQLAKGDLGGLEQAIPRACAQMFRKHGLPGFNEIADVMRDPGPSERQARERLAEIAREHCGNPMTRMAAQLAGRQIANGVPDDAAIVLTGALLSSVVSGYLLTPAQPSMVPTDAFPDHAAYGGFRSLVVDGVKRHATHFARCFARDPLGTKMRAPRMARVRLAGDEMTRLLA